MTRIGVCGFIGSGKDTVADILEEKEFIRFAFADTVKEVANVLFDWPLDMLQGRTEESRAWREEIDIEWSEILGYDITPRQALQKIGTECCRNVFGENIFVGKVLKKIKNKYPDKNVIITDCRFENEISLLKKNDFKIAHINRDSKSKSWYTDYKNGVDVEEVNSLHPSEYRWIRCDFDVEIDNNGTKDDLKHNISMSFDTI